MNGKTYIGLRERIAHAATVEEVNALLEQGGTYTQADERTRRSWHATANRRILELSAPLTAKVLNACGAFEDGPIRTGLKHIYNNVVKGGTK